MSKKKYRHSVTKTDEIGAEQTNNSLFSESDANSVEIADYTLSHGASQMNPSNSDYSIPTGVVDIDESTDISLPSLNSHHQHASKSNALTRRREIHEREHVNLPSIAHRSHKYNPYEYYCRSPNYNHSECSYHLNSINDKTQSFHYKLDPNRYHHDPKGDTYDPRWWYMPLHSVHGPKSHRRINHQYIPKKWYELPNKH
ncbi:unnamed protein product [Rotaria magnacalcarata]|uniref:Uncharacterized protein n=3 Tax=Rotaria magnacalcarata TaxID=392030 RepID=A0A816EEG7_9BILA|nr:unnamed protein product [Rotaria magnacalcarata]CAF2071491.1 unnamed protein product [Rotaria magnacalcarata]CAF4150411.1 unnamed protein product [Rotaria magnacalcarata]